MEGPSFAMRPWKSWRNRSFQSFIVREYLPEFAGLIADRDMSLDTAYEEVWAK